jgi:hypothetical protein
MSGSHPRRSPSRRKFGPGVRPDDAILGAIGGFGLAYVLLVPHGFEHPWHWVASGAGGLVGGAGVWLYAERERLKARIRDIVPRCC